MPKIRIRHSSRRGGRSQDNKKAIASLFTWFGNFIKSKEVLKAIRKFPNVFVRKFKFPWLDVLLYLIFRNQKCTSSDLSRYYSHIGLSELRISRQAVFKAVRKVNPDVFILLIHRFAEKFYKSELVKKYKGYVLLAEDGTTLNLYKTEQSVTQYGFVSNQLIRNKEDARKATSQSAALYDVTNGLIIDFAMKHYGESEIPIAIEQLESISLLNGHPAIYLADRYYNSVELFSILESKGLKYCIRGKSNFCKQYISKMKTDDEWIEVKLDKQWLKRLKYDQPRQRFSENPYIRIRVVKYRYNVVKEGKAQQIELIYFTNLSQDEFDSDEIRDLYAKRWDLETSYKTLKTELEWERYFSKDCDSETCAIYAKVIFHNLCGIVRKEMDQELERISSESDKHTYRINVKQLIALIQDERMVRWIRNENSRKTVKTVDLVLKLIHKIKVPVRPGRHYPRWNRIIFQGKTMRFRLDGRDWPNTRSHNGVLITVAP